MKCTQKMNIIANIHCLKNDTGVAHYNVNAHQPILVIFCQRCC